MREKEVSPKGECIYAINSCKYVRNLLSYFSTLIIFLPLNGKRKRFFLNLFFLNWTNFQLRYPRWNAWEVKGEKGWALDNGSFLCPFSPHILAWSHTLLLFSFDWCAGEDRPLGQQGEAAQCDRGSLCVHTAFEGTPLKGCWTHWQCWNVDHLERKEHDIIETQSNRFSEEQELTTIHLWSGELMGEKSV